MSAALPAASRLFIHRKEIAMNPLSCVLAGAALVLLPGHFLAQGRGEVLVPGNPPLTQAMVQLDIAAKETLFDLTFSAEQRREYQRLFMDEWRSRDLRQKQAAVKSLATWSRLPSYNTYQRNLLRAMYQRKMLEILGKPDANPRSRWLLELYESAYKPGSPRNPVLVEGELPLTQILVDRYRDFLEVMLDLSITNGFSREQRQQLQDYLVKGWKKMRGANLMELATDLKDWSDAAATAKASEANRSISVLRPRLMARLQSSRDDDLNNWLLEVLAQARRQSERQSDIERRRHETMMRVIDGLRPPPGSWRYSAASGRYIWVPGR
jgi:hypothetical protein